MTVKQWPDTIQKDCVKLMREALGLSQERFAVLMDVSVRTITRAEREVKIPNKLIKPLRNLNRILTDLDPQMKQDSEALVRWLASPAVGMGRYSPRDLIWQDFGTEVLLNKIRDLDD